MPSDHIWLLRRPLPPKSFPPMVKQLPAARPSAGAVIPLDAGDPGKTGSNREKPHSPVLRAAPPTPLLPDTSSLDRVTEGFPWKPPRTLSRNPLLELLESDVRFQAPPPAFCLSDFLQSHSGSKFSSEPTPTSTSRTRTTVS